MKYLFLLFVLVITGCGYSALNGELSGQAKAIEHRTPIICPNYSIADISLGIMRNGVGSMSTGDSYLEIVNPEHIKIFEEAAEQGKLVKVKYNSRRVTICVPNDIVTEISIVE